MPKSSVMKLPVLGIPKAPSSSETQLQPATGGAAAAPNRPARATFGGASSTDGPIGHAPSRPNTGAAVPPRQSAAAAPPPRTSDTAHLRIPLYMLNRLKSGEDFSGFSESDIQGLRQAYSGEELGEIRRALAFAKENPTLDLTPLVEGSRFSNVEIHAFAHKIHQALEEGLREADAA
jgi:hypothetical protein